MGNMGHSFLQVLQHLYLPKAAFSGLVIANRLDSFKINKHSNKTGNLILTDFRYKLYFYVELKNI